jgi:hypothetical protein
VLTRNLSVHLCEAPGQLQKLVVAAQRRRATACTAKNDESSRSHGVAIITLGPIASAADTADNAAYAPGGGG